MIPMSIAVAAGFVAWFTLVEVGARCLGMDRELSRKLVHLTSGLAAAALPLLLPQREIVGLGVAFAALMAVSRRFRSLPSVHEVDRATWGEVCLPLGVAAAAVLLPSPAAYAWAVVTVAVSDVAACFVGRRIGRKRYPLPGGTKTLAGSTAFLISTLALGLVMLPGLPVGLAAVVLAAVAATAVEALAPRGLDNLAIPLTVAAVVLAS